MESTMGGNKVEPQTLSPPGAGNAQIHHRIDGQAPFGNRLAALGASAVFAVCNAPERRLDALQIASPSTLARLSHGLLLHGVHARQPADRLLVKPHSGAVILRQRRQLLQLALQRQQLLTRRIRVDCPIAPPCVQCAARLARS